jgi:hypothetical protein
MKSESAPGTSRSGFLKQAAGATIAVAGAGVGAGAVASEAAAFARGPRQTVSLVLDGVECGRLGDADGGGAEYAVDLDRVGSDGIQRKHIGKPTFEDITLQVGSGMGKPMYDWIQASIETGKVRKSGAIDAADFKRDVRYSRHFFDALITEVTIPALDGASKDPAYLTVTVSPTTVTDAQPSGQTVPAAKQKAWLPNNFVFEIDGVDTSRVASIDSFTWKCSVAADGSLEFDVSDIGVSLPPTGLSSWKEWYASLGGGADDERDGTLTLVGADRGGVVTIGLSNLGLYRFNAVPVSSTQSRVVKAQMYCESVKFTKSSFNN